MLLNAIFLLTSLTAVALAIPAFDLFSLNASVKGRLHTTQPLALPCYLSYSNGTTTQTNVPNIAACAEISTQTSNSSFIADHPGGYITSNFGICQTTQQGCPLGVADQVLQTCHQGNVPSYYVDVREPSDVAAVLAFAHETGVPIVVKNTGHDYKGRSAAPGALALWMHNVQPPIQLTPDFTPEGSSAPVGPTLTYGAGQGFQGIYETAHAHGMMAIGGTSPTVGASGGWVTGGGHSALSPTYGLGVDNVMEMKAVLPNGTYVTANRCQNQDIFFALRGGGGGTFGVLMETTSRVYPELPLQHATIIAPNLDLVDGIHQAVSLVVNNTEQWSADGWGGYMAAGVKGVGLIFIDMITPKLTLDEAKASMKPATDFATALLPNLSVPITVEIKTHANYWEYYNSAIAQSLSKQGVGTGVAMASRLISTQNFATPAKKSQLIDTFTTYGGFGSVANVYNAMTRAPDPLRAITPEGAYQNEGDTYEPNPEESFWGKKNYERFLAIKREVDAGNVLTCHQCVGWDEGDGRFGCYPQVR
ncbi:hypothetical protein M409DRAFT_66592 [Zasmidium cellare ATCC 36951]|uniref:FAD-binding PCMH-type domain-containing protein n=1 Tax=Zasmidium cellare ATCC 36951 TaxID=1080233 RepID=A0A6A6CKW0_ZASCE|nr:uncharacterized protein M409DRAFT_66592 [Zasmidium cellare ATCC 36951]KAF2166572.1 hypothetical protein M409DRAFT_66592 [Zasmidium cellare ATCC 36951]